MMVVIFIFCSLFGESIHIELPYIRMHFVVFEEMGENSGCESIFIDDKEPCLLFVPPNNVFVV